MGEVTAELACRGTGSPLMIWCCIRHSIRTQVWWSMTFDRRLGVKSSLTTRANQLRVQSSGSTEVFRNTAPHRWARPPSLTERFGLTRAKLPISITVIACMTLKTGLRSPPGSTLSLKTAAPL